MPGMSPTCIQLQGRSGVVQFSEHHSGARRSAGVYKVENRRGCVEGGSWFTIYESRSTDPVVARKGEGYPRSITRCFWFRPQLLAPSRGARRRDEGEGRTRRTVASGALWDVVGPTLTQSWPGSRTPCPVPCVAGLGT